MYAIVRRGKSNPESIRFVRPEYDFQSGHTASIQTFETRDEAEAKAKEMGADFHPIQIAFDPSEVPTFTPPQPWSPETPSAEAEGFETDTEDEDGD